MLFPFWNFVYSIWMEEEMKVTKTLGQDIWSLDRNSNSSFPQFESGMLTT
jgi:hypothetical protein